MQRLIDRQTKLLRHMTSSAFIFGTQELESAARDPDLAGMDIRRLRLEAEFSYNKRMKKIRKTFERTANLLGQRFSVIAREFASVYPPKTYERYPDARCFLDYFLERWAHEPPTPACTADVAAIELALSRARTLRPTAMETQVMAECPRPSSSLWYRIHPCAVLVRCGYDVRPLFEPARSGEAVSEREVYMAVLASPGRRRPMVVELTPEAFALLERSKEWLPLEANPAANDTGAADAHHRDLVNHLAELGLMLMSGNDAGDGSRG